MQRLKLALGALLALGLWRLCWPGGFRTAGIDAFLALLSLAGLAVVLLAGWGVTVVAGHYSRRAGNRRYCQAAGSLPPAFPDPPPAGGPATAFDRLAAGSYAVPAGTACSGGCGRPAAVAVSYADGRPPARFCRPCHADEAASGRRADGCRDLPAPGLVPAAPDNTPGHADMSGFEFETGS